MRVGVLTALGGDGIARPDFHQATVPHDTDAVAQRAYQAEVVRDEEKCQAVLVAEPLQESEDLPLQRYVQP